MCPHHGADQRLLAFPQVCAPAKFRLGSLSLAQIEEVNRRNDAMKLSIEGSFTPIVSELTEEKNKMKFDLNVILKRV